MRTIFVYIMVIIYMLFTALKRVKLYLIRKFSTESKAQAYIEKIVIRWAQFMVKVIGIKIEMQGKVPEETCLFVANHQSNLDIPVMLAAMGKPAGFIAKKEMERLPIVSFWMRQIQCVFMDRSNPREALKSIIEGAEHLKQGNSMVIFPEGTRSQGAQMGEFKKGSIKLGLKAAVPIVPVTIHGTYKALEANKGKIKKATVKIIIGEPIHTKLLSKEEQGELTEVLQEKIKGNLEKQLLG